MAVLRAEMGQGKCVDEQRCEVSEVWLVCGEWVEHCKCCAFARLLGGNKVGMVEESWMEGRWEWERTRRGGGGQQRGGGGVDGCWLSRPEKRFSYAHPSFDCVVLDLSLLHH